MYRITVHGDDHARNRAEEVGGGLYAFEGAEFLTGHHIITFCGEIHVGDVTHFLLGKIGYADIGHIAFYLYPFVRLGILESFQNLRHSVLCFIFCNWFDKISS